jgi:lysine-N-methylase
MAALRPRLAEHVVARLHRRGATERLVLLDTKSDRVVELDARAWSVLGCADGTRDREGIVAAARRFGVTVGIDEVAALLDRLDGFAWLADGAPHGLLEGAPDPATRADERPIRELVAARYRCDGRGACCRSYGTISLTPSDVHRAAVATDDHALQHRPHAVMLPIHGSAPTVMRAVALVDGGCRFVEDDGRCRIHRAAGPEAKPVGCRWFPTQLVDDGDEVRAAPAVECICVAQPEVDAPPLFDPVRVCDLPLGLSLRRIPARVPAAAQTIERARALGHVDDTLDPESGDPAMQLWSLASVLAGRSAAAPDPVALAARIAAVARRAAVRADVEASWRGDADLVVVRLRMIATASTLLSAPTMLAAIVASEGDSVERHALRVARFLRTPLLDEDAALSCEDAAVRMWIARAVAALALATDADLTMRDTPLAAVAAAWRAERLGA